MIHIDRLCEGVYVCVWRCVLGDPSVGGHDEDGGHVTLQSTIKERETLNIQHVYLVNKQHLE